MSLDFVILCRKPLPALEDGWDASAWPAPKTYAAVSIWRIKPGAWRKAMRDLAAEGAASPEVMALLEEDFADVLGWNFRSAAFEFAEGYMTVVARATAGVIVAESQEIFGDFGPRATPLTGPEILAAWQRIDNDEHEALYDVNARAEAEWQRLASEQPAAIQEANDWSDVAPDSSPTPERFTVTLVSAGRRPARVIAALRHLWPHLSPEEASAYCDVTPSTLLDAGERDDVDTIVAPLEAAGAKLDVVPH